MALRYLNSYLLFPYLEKRSGRKIKPKIKELRQYSEMDPEVRERIQREQFYKALCSSRQNIPYYKDLFLKCGFDENKVLKDIRYIQDLPLITKEIIREHQARLRLPEAHHIRKTGGSTGESVFFFYDDEGLDWTAAVNARSYEMVGNLPHMRDCHICSELGVGPTTTRGKFLDWLKLLAQNRKRLMIHSFSDNDLEQTFQSLKKIRPYMVQGHPSSGYAIANHIRLNQYKKRKYCDIFEPSGEMLTSKTVEVIEKYLGCKVVNRYGNAEFGVIAHTTLEDSYKDLRVFDRLFYVEPVTKGNLIVSNCTNASFPLFRYDTGDMGTVVKKPGQTWIHDIQGRVHDVVDINGEPYATHYIMDYLDHKIHGVREFQIVLTQESPVPIWRIVAEDPSDESRIQKMIFDKWPDGIRVEFVKIQDLLRVGWQQKFRHVVDMRKASP